MKRWLPLHSRRRELALGVAAALLITLFAWLAGTGATAGDGLQLFHTRGHVLLVRLTLHPDAPPTIDGVTRPVRGRITPLVPGENAIWLADARGKVLYQRFFAADFFQLSDPPVQVDRVTLVVILPDVGNARRIVVTTPAGMATAEVSR